MIEIKFRGKSRLTGKLVYGLPKYHSGGGIGYICGWWGEDGAEVYEEEEIVGETISLYTGINDKNKQEIYIDDTIKDLMTGMEYIVKFGFCKKRGFVGVYCENEDGYQVPLNGDYDTNQNSNVEVL